MASASFACVTTTRMQLRHSDIAANLGFRYYFICSFGNHYCLPWAFWSCCICSRTAHQGDRHPQGHGSIDSGYLLPTLKRICKMGLDFQYHCLADSLFIFPEVAAEFCLPDGYPYPDVYAFDGLGAVHCLHYGELAILQSIVGQSGEGFEI